MKGWTWQGILGLACGGAVLACASGRAQETRIEAQAAAPAATLSTNCDQASPPEFVDLQVMVSRPAGGPATAGLDYKVAEVCVGARGPRKVRWTLQDSELATTLLVAWRQTPQHRTNYFQLTANPSRQVRAAGVVGSPQAGSVWDYELVVTLGDGNAIAVDPQIIWR